MWRVTNAAKRHEVFVARHKAGEAQRRQRQKYLALGRGEEVLVHRVVQHDEHRLLRHRSLGAIGLAAVAVVKAASLGLLLSPRPPVEVVNVRRPAPTEDQLVGLSAQQGFAGRGRRGSQVYARRRRRRRGGRNARGGKRRHDRREE